MIYKDQIIFNIFLKNTEFVTDCRMPNKNDNFRKWIGRDQNHFRFLFLFFTNFISVFFVIILVSV
jgi:hypothetical protein